MNIPDNIVEQAASESFGPDWDNAHPEDQRYHRNEARKILNAAAPFIAAQALCDAVADLEPYNGRARVPGDEFRDGIDYAQEALTDRANELDPQ